MPASIKHALVETYEDVLRNHTLQMAAALSYYSFCRSFRVSSFYRLFIGYCCALARSQFFRPGAEYDDPVLASGQHGAGPQSCLT
jgi:hypothetical protein